MSEFILPFLHNISYWQIIREPGFLRFLSGRRKVSWECFKLLTNLNADPMSRPIRLAECKVIKT